MKMMKRSKEAQEAKAELDLSGLESVIHQIPEEDEEDAANAEAANEARLAKRKESAVRNRTIKLPSQVYHISRCKVPANALVIRCFEKRWTLLVLRRL